MTKHIILGIDISNFVKVRDVFVNFSQHLATDQEKAGAVQAFKFCFELSWKTRSPRDCFREGTLNKLINNPELWFVVIEKRNLTVHTYEEKIWRV